MGLSLRQSIYSRLWATRASVRSQVPPLLAPAADDAGTIVVKDRRRGRAGRLSSLAPAASGARERSRDSTAVRQRRGRVSGDLTAGRPAWPVRHHRRPVRIASKRAIRCVQARVCLRRRYGSIRCSQLGRGAGKRHVQPPLGASMAFGDETRKCSAIWSNALLRWAGQPSLGKRHRGVQNRVSKPRR